MWIDRHNVRCTLTQSSALERAWLDVYLRFRAKSGLRSSKEQKLYHPGDGRTPPSFPAGLLSLVQGGAAEKGFEVLVNDRRSRPCEPDASADLAWLLPHQLAGVEACVSETCGIVKVATSGGKGEIAVALGKKLPCRWLFGAHRFALVDDIARRWDARGDGSRAGRIGDGTWDEGDGRFVGATAQTLAPRILDRDPAALALLAQVEGVIWDEIHTAASDQVRAVFNACPRAYWRFGLSGTPLNRSDMRSILSVASTGPIIYEVKADELVRLGVSSRCTVRMLRVRQPAVEWDFGGGYDRAVVRSKARNAAVVRAVLASTKPVLIFFKSLEHGAILQKMVERAGVPCKVASGRDTQQSRVDKLRWLVREGHAALLANKIFQEGEVDKCLSQIRDVVNCVGGESTIVALQQLGRGMRVDRCASTGAVLKDEFTLWDFFDETDGDGEPTAIERHARKRASAYAKAGHRVLVED